MTAIDKAPSRSRPGRFGQLSSFADRLSRQISHNRNVHDKEDNSADMRLACDGQDLERQQTARRHDDEPGAPPLAMEKSPTLEQARNAVGRERNDDDPQPAAGRGSHDEIGQVKAPGMRLVTQMSRETQHARTKVELHRDHDGNREYKPETPLDELVPDDDDKPGLASHSLDCRLDLMRAHRVSFAAGLLAALTVLVPSSANGDADGATNSVASVFPPRIVGRPVRLDEHHRLLSWSRSPSPYAHVTRLAWEALETRFPVQDNGVETWLTFSRFDPLTFEGVSWPHNPAGLYAMLADSAVLWYAFSGDEAAVALVQKALDYQLEHGTTPSGWQWPDVPYASAGAGDTDYRGADDTWCDGCGRGDGIGVIEPDKVGELGYAYLQFYELTGQERYRNAAVACADALAKHVRTGDERHSPWPFRVYAETNAVREEYSSNVIGALLLFDGLARSALGDVRHYAAARSMALAWLFRVPLENDAWSGYFEDIAIQPNPAANPNQYSALRTAWWLLAHRADDPRWHQHVKHLLEWAVRTFGADTPSERGLQWGATVMSEQAADRAKMGSHTARLGAANALWYEVTGDPTVKEHAARSLNWATYVCDDRGVVAVGQDANEGWWFSDGYGDYTRQFLNAMAAVPEWAPPHESHLLRSTSIVTRVAYLLDRVEWTSFERGATETLRLPARPTSVSAAGVRLAERNDVNGEGYFVRALASGDVVVQVHHGSRGPVVVTTDACRILEASRPETSSEAAPGSRMASMQGARFGAALALACALALGLARLLVNWRAR